ncbi:hypothetical protein [Micromonospora sp. DT233]|uniref:hypothetical protein n=1 Tax=Micromonospora sp. DT233 TaxID=3393432 RepID=UPI003CF35FF3
MPAPFALHDFCAELQRLRGRTLVVTAVRTRSAGAQALWCKGATTDHILVGSALPRPHRDHLALHGIGHMVFEHVGGPAVGHALGDALSKSVVARLRLARKRVVYTRREERQAEVFATRVQQLAGVWTTRNTPSAPHALLLERLSSVLEQRPRRAER